MFSKEESIWLQAYTSAIRAQCNGAQAQEWAEWMLKDFYNRFPDGAGQRVLQAVPVRPGLHAVSTAKGPAAVGPAPVGPVPVGPVAIEPKPIEEK
jgi:hypothetical protein